jgi:hypothetical protein
MQASDILRTVESGGGAVWLAGESVRYRLPKSMFPMPPGVRLVRWEPLPAPVQLNRCEIVPDSLKAHCDNLERG